jgi:phage-related protein
LGTCQEATIYRLEFYQAPRGEYPAKDFLNSLPEPPRMKVAAWLGLLQEKGPNLHRPYADVLDEPIRELRVSSGRLEVRLLYFIHGKSIVVTHGFLKKRREIPKREIELAKRYRNEWLIAFGGGRS